MSSLPNFRWALLAAGLLAGCRHAPPAGTGSSSFRYVDPPAASPARSAKGEVEQADSRARYREASPSGELARPKYPARALAARAGTVTVGVHVTVDSTGKVTDVRPSILTFTMPGPFAADFWQAAEAAVRQWKFHPAKIEHLETVTQNGFSYNRVTRTDYVEAEFDLQFTFSPDDHQ